MAVPADPVDALLATRFLPSAPRYTAHDSNTITAFINVADYYNDLATLIDGAGVNVTGDFVVFAGWSFDLDTPVTVAGTATTLRAVLTGAAARSVQVRAILFDHVTRHPNAAQATWISQLVDLGKRGVGGAILDDHLPKFGSHHQKIAAICSKGQFVAYCGGMDFETGRVRPPAGGPWHDVQVRVQGPTAYDLWDNWAQRWDLHSSRAKGATWRPQPALPAVPTGSLKAQVVRTLPNSSAIHVYNSLNDLAGVLGSTLLAASHIPGLSTSSPYITPAGEHSYYDLLAQTIDKATTTLYIEDQYLVCSTPMGTLKALGEVIGTTVNRPGFQQLIAVTAGVGTIQGDLYQVNRRRAALWAQLGSAASKASVWAYKGGGQFPSAPYWFHAKLVIADDRFAVIGSANASRRSHSHDSELGIGIADPQPGTGVNWVHQLRINLWSKHLNSDRPGTVAADDLADFVPAARKYWQEAPAMPLDKLDLVKGEPSQIDRRLSDPILAQTPHTLVGGIPLSMWPSLIDTRRIVVGVSDAGFDYDWGIIDPDGTTSSPLLGP